MAKKKKTFIKLSVSKYAHFEPFNLLIYKKYMFVITTINDHIITQQELVFFACL